MSLCTSVRHLVSSTHAVKVSISPRFATRLSTPLFSGAFRANIHHTARPTPKFNARDLLEVGKWSRRTKLVATVLGAGSVYYLYHLERAPVTGRLRFMDVSPEEEHSIAVQSYRQLLAEFEGKILPQDHILTRHVRRVVRRILQGSHLGHIEGGIPGEEVLADSFSDGYDTGGQGQNGLFNTLSRKNDWKVLVINDDRIMNAAVVNDVVIVFTGILPLCKDENGLAAVLGHEIAHVLARHAAERISSNRVLTVLAFILDPLLGIDMNLTQLVTSYALQLPNSRVQELEADRIGLNLTAQACYDPQMVPEMQKRLATLESRVSNVVEFLQTHPSSARRANMLETYLPDAYNLQAASPFCAGMQSQVNSFREAAGSYDSETPKNQKSEWLS